MGNAADKADLVIEREARRDLFQFGILWAAADENDAHARINGQDLRQGSE